MYTPESIKEGETYLFPHPYVVGIVKTVIMEIFERDGQKYVRHESAQATMGTSPTIEDFCEMANLADALCARP